jgi:hypothetical protein
VQHAVGSNVTLSWLVSVQVVTCQTDSNGKVYVRRAWAEISPYLEFEFVTKQQSF